MRVVKPGPDRDVPRGVLGGAEISQATAGAQNIYMGRFRVPPGSRSRPHYHEGCESAVYMLSGQLRVKWGDHLEHEFMLEPGDLVYVPPRETHVLENTSDDEAAEYGPQAEEVGAAGFIPKSEFSPERLLEAWSAASVTS